MTGSFSEAHGGYLNADTGKANGNTLIIESGADVYYAYGGIVTDGGGCFGEATGNTVIVRGGRVSDMLRGGCADTSANNTLIMDKVKGFSVGWNVDLFDNLVVNLPADITPDTPVLSTRWAGFSGVANTVDIKVTGSPALKEGDKITLISTTESLTFSLSTEPLTVKDTDSDYEFAVSKSSDGKSLIAEVTKVGAAVEVIVTPEANYPECSSFIKCMPTTTVANGNVTCTAEDDPSGVCTYVPDSIKLKTAPGAVNDASGCSGSGNTCTLKGVIANVTVSAEFTKKHRIIGRAKPAEGGTIKCPSDLLEDGATTSFTCDIKPTDGYYLDWLEADWYGECNMETGKCSVSDVGGDVNVFAYFREHANLTGITLSNLRNEDTTCGGVTADVNVEGSGNFCVKFTIEQNGKTATASPGAILDAPLNWTGVPLFGPGPWEGDFGDDLSGMTDAPFTLSYSAGNMPDCKGITRTVKISGCAAPTLTNIYTVSVKANKPDAPTITCDKTSVEDGETVTCSYTPDANWKPNLTSLTLPSGCNFVGETAVTCTVTDNINVTIPFDKVESGGGSTGGGSTGGGSTGGGSTGGGSTGSNTGNTPGGNAPGTGGNDADGSDDAGNGAGNGGGNSSSPTMGELGLLLSGIALAGAAAPALRRRERKARKQT